MRQRLYSVGDVIVTAVGVTNPYTYEGPETIGDDRVRALRAFRDGGDTAMFWLWYAPAGGGAKTIDASEVDWSGLNHYDTTKSGQRIK